ncbi:hypothetical protein OCAR_4877 [Afipia carboxidovorans OM5]|uniref:Uncharacterized protein n=1 Tax=Afipia carboxidovorans (strain ATCC 49405 / DSM 1227 / KCTC 32145 / OM5) TaxID=504832 RepID=B6JDT4_AFIC5|nr:hypothetical protein OCAR_4877 [Afipia carboxidovorans OM5]AEI04128.1 hypothetical protein OCA4_c30220 [Afipia carboxidovorans OM4]AEI07758.1 hypothetical protein OCA5_c30740 [Afipia carboxidovorans OM5]
MTDAVRAPGMSIRCLRRPSTDIRLKKKPLPRQQSLSCAIDNDGTEKEALKAVS